VMARVSLCDAEARPPPPSPTLPIRATRRARPQPLPVRMGVDATTAEVRPGRKGGLAGVWRRGPASIYEPQVMSLKTSPSQDICTFEGSLKGEPLGFDNAVRVALRDANTREARPTSFSVALGSRMWQARAPSRCTVDGCVPRSQHGNLRIVGTVSGCNTGEARPQPLSSRAS